MKTKTKIGAILTVTAPRILTVGLGDLLHGALQKERHGLLAERTTLEEKAALLEEGLREGADQDAAAVALA